MEMDDKVNVKAEQAAGSLLVDTFHSSDRETE